MTRAAEIICHIQPVTGVAIEAGTAWVDTGKTATIRRAVSTKAEAEMVIAEAMEIASALGGAMVIKTMARAIYGARRPAGVPALQGNYLVR